MHSKERGNTKLRLIPNDSSPKVTNLKYQARNGDLWNCQTMLFFHFIRFKTDLSAWSLYSLHFMDILGSSANHLEMTPYAAKMFWRPISKWRAAILPIWSLKLQPPALRILCGQNTNQKTPFQHCPACRVPRSTKRFHSWTCLQDCQ